MVVLLPIFYYYENNKNNIDTICYYYLKNEYNAPLDGEVFFFPIVISTRILDTIVDHRLALVALLREIHKHETTEPAFPPSRVWCYITIEKEVRREAAAESQGGREVRRYPHT